MSVILSVSLRSVMKNCYSFLVRLSVHIRAIRSCSLRFLVYSVPGIQLQWIVILHGQGLIQRVEGKWQVKHDMNS